MTAMNDVPWHITVTNLQPNHNYTIVSSCKPDVDAKTFIAYAHYVSDGNGNIDLDKSKSQGGTYVGIEPMGLMWSLAVEKGVQEADIGSPKFNDKNFMKNNVSSPIKVMISVSEGHDKFEDVQDLQFASFLTQQTVERLYMSPQCLRIPLREGRLRGTLFVPSGEGPFSAVIDIYGGGGGLQEARASLLASHDYVTLALAFYCFDDLPRTLEVELEYFVEAIKFVSSLPYVRKSGIGILALCYGGPLAMHLAVICPQIKAVVSICGTSYLIGIGKATYRKETISYGLDENKIKTTDKGICFSNLGPVIEKRCIPIERAANCKFLFINGEDDAVVSWAHAKLLHSRALASSQLFLYKGAGHVIDPPYTPHIESRWLKGLKKAVFYGGSVDNHAKAQEAAWNEILLFFRLNL